MRRLRLPVAVALLLALAAALVTAQPVEIAPGVTVEAFREAEGPWEVRVIRIERDAPQIALLASAGRGELRGNEVLTRIVRRERTQGAGVIAAVNADFFRMSGATAGGVSGPFVRDGELITIARGRPGFYVTADGQPRIEDARTSGEVAVGGGSWPLDSTNMPDEGGEGAVQLFSQVGGWELTEGCLAATLEEGPLGMTGRWEATISAVVAAGTARTAGPGEVLIATRDEQVRGALLSCRVGERVRITLDTPPFEEPVLQAVGGNRILLRGGEIVYEDNVRHPRTAAGYNDSEIVLVTVDGRQPGWSVGMTMAELARLMQRLGCAEAINLDGGGSTTAWAQHFVVNRPSGGVQRAIANALLVVRDGHMARPTAE